MHSGLDPEQGKRSRSYRVYMARNTQAVQTHGFLTLVWLVAHNGHCDWVEAAAACGHAPHQRVSAPQTTSACSATTPRPTDSQGTKHVPGPLSPAERSTRTLFLRLALQTCSGPSAPAVAPTAAPPCGRRGCCPTRRWAAWWCCPPPRWSGCARCPTSDCRPAPCCGTAAGASARAQGGRGRAVHFPSATAGSTLSDRLLPSLIHGLHGLCPGPMRWLGTGLSFRFVGCHPCSAIPPPGVALVPFLPRRPQVPAG